MTPEEFQAQTTAIASLAKLAQKRELPLEQAEQWAREGAAAGDLVLFEPCGRVLFVGIPRRPAAWDAVRVRELLESARRRPDVLETLGEDVTVAERWTTNGGATDDAVLIALQNAGTTISRSENGAP
jgi:hypothetical protein